MQKGVSGIRHGELWKLLLRCFGSEILLLAIYWWACCCMRPLVLLNAFLPLPARDKKISGTALVFFCHFLFSPFFSFPFFSFLLSFFRSCSGALSLPFFLYFLFPPLFHLWGEQGSSHSNCCANRAGPPYFGWLGVLELLFGPPPASLILFGRGFDLCSTGCLKSWLCS